MEGQTGKASWLREAFEFINVSFSNSAFPLSEPTIFCDDSRRGGISTCGVPFRSQTDDRSHWASAHYVMVPEIDHLHKKQIVWVRDGASGRGRSVTCI